MWLFDYMLSDQVTNVVCDEFLCFRIGYEQPGIDDLISVGKIFDGFYNVFAT